MSADSRGTERSSSLSSRPSFFGGSVSTREASAVSTWKVPKLSETSNKSGPKPGQQLKRAAGAPQTSTRPAAAAPPPPDPLLLKTARLKASRNFDSDSDTEADNTKSNVYSQALSNLQHHVSKQEKDAAARRPQKARPVDNTQLEQREYSPGKLSNAQQNAGSHKSRVVLPMGKAGAASRQMALAPQAISLSRKQMADRGIRQAVDSVRGSGPSPPPSRPPSTAPHVSFSQQAPIHNAASRLQSNTSRPQNMANAHQRHINGSTSSTSRPHSSAGHAQAGSVRPSPNGQHSGSAQNGFARPHSQSTAQQQGNASRDRAAVNGPMPAWMQKARAAMAGKKRMQRDDYDDDGFVVEEEEEPDWRQALKGITRYDPSKYDDRGFDDRSMEANYRQIQAEERRSARMGRDDDAKAEMEELRHQEEKKRKKKKAKSNALVM